jgi:hypothetical protein
MANDKVSIWNQTIKLGRPPANGELLIGDGVGFTFSSLSSTLDNISSTQGSILYRGASYWVALAPGTSGQFLQTNGGGANPAWAAVGNIPSLSQIEFISGIIPVPSNTDYRIVVQLPYGLTINSTTTIATSGTCTATFKINTTALGGTANSVSTSEQEQTHSSANVAAAGDDLVITVSSNSSCLNMSFTIKYTRTFV